jgi:hypothetical protein
LPGAIRDAKRLQFLSGSCAGVHAGIANGQEQQMTYRLPATALICLLASACAGKPAPAAAPPAPSPESAMRDACTGAASVQYGVEANRITLAAEITTATDGGFALDGSVDKGAEGIKLLKCRFDASRKLLDVMAMTPDGE